MKLVELLARELKEWPSGAKCMTQNSDASAVMLKSLDVVYRNEIWVGADGFSIVGFRNLSELATDHATAIVTRADWEAEKARIAGKVDGGWKRHRGGKQPVADGVRVDYRLRNGRHGINERSELLDWVRSDESPESDIMAFRIRTPAEQPAPVSEEAIIEDKTGNLASLTVPHHMLFGYASKEGMREATGCESLQEAVQMITKGYVTYAPDAVEQDGPLAWRDRIRTLDTQRAELEATYQRQIGEIAKERGELVDRLAQEGLALVEVAVQPVEDMSDPVNWRKGDLITFVEEDKDSCFTTGKQYVFEGLYGYGSAGVLADDEGDENGWAVEYFKWHSRPGK